MCLLATQRSDKKWMCYCVHIFSGAQERVTSKFTDRSGRNSYSSEILCLSWLPASLIMIRSKLKPLLCPQHFLLMSLRKFFSAQGWVTRAKVLCVEVLWPRTDNGPLVYYKLALWTFGSGELKMHNSRNFFSLTCSGFIICAKSFWIFYAWFWRYRNSTQICI